MNYGAVGISDRLDGKLVLGHARPSSSAPSSSSSRSSAWPWTRAPTGRSGRSSIGAALGVGVMVIGPLTGAGFNPARAFGPALVSGEFGGAGDFLARLRRWPRCIGRGGRGVVYFYLFITPGAKGPEGLEPVG